MHCVTATAFFALALAARAHAAFDLLPRNGAQVNDDAANAIDAGQDAGVSNVAVRLLVPWATFAQRSGTSQHLFVRAFEGGKFEGGKWVTQGLPASLNIDPAANAEAPSIDFAGAYFGVPWVAWCEPSSHFGARKQIFASRFDAVQNLWLPSGQDRGFGLPSLNIDTNRTAQNPSVAGGTTTAGNDPIPWVTWEEDGGTAKRQIFVSKGVEQTGNGTACGAYLNGFCWQQVGLERLDPMTGASSATGDPTLNVDPSRNAVEPHIALTGTADTGPWTVWYEKDAAGIPGLGSTAFVFAAKAVPDATANGSFHWVAVGNGTAGKPPQALDRSGANQFGPCAESLAAEQACALNRSTAADAEHPRVATGTLQRGDANVPWVVWQEEIGGGVHAVFVSRLVGGDHFELLNDGQPVSNTSNDSARPDIAFSRNVPYVSWQESVGGAFVTFVGHFEGTLSAPTFVRDTPTGLVSSGLGSTTSLRAPISSACKPNPTDDAGPSCRELVIACTPTCPPRELGNHVIDFGTPIVLFSAGAAGGVKRLFAEAYAPSDVSTLAATHVTATGATLRGRVNPGGALANVRFDIGPTTAYQTSRDARPTGVASVLTDASLDLRGFQEGTTLHFRMAAESDFAGFEGSDQEFTTPSLRQTQPTGGLPRRVKRHKLGRDRVLAVPVTVTEAATVTVELRRKRGRSTRVLRTAHGTVDAAGVATVDLPLKRLPPGKYRLHIVATYAVGVTSKPIDSVLRLDR